MTLHRDTELILIKDKIAELEDKLTGNMFDDMELRDKIHNLRMRKEGIKPIDSEVECIGCGS